MEECDEAGNYEKPDMFRVENHGKRLAKRKKKKKESFGGILKNLH